MAGDWLKVEIATPDKPEVWSIASSLKIDPDAVVGKLLRVWIWFDQHTEKGNAPSVTKKLLDRITGVTGFCDEVISVGWMIEQDGFLILPNFKRHNGKTAKNRALTALRVANHRQKSNAESNAENVTSALAREEKRREKDIGVKTSRFTPPTVTEVSEYCRERNNNVDPQRWHDFYESKNWYVGKNKMKNWKAAVRTWEGNSTPAQNGYQKGAL